MWAAPSTTTCSAVGIASASSCAAAAGVVRSCAPLRTSTGRVNERGCRGGRSSRTRRPAEKWRSTSGRYTTRSSSIELTARAGLPGRRRGTAAGRPAAACTRQAVCTVLSRSHEAVTCSRRCAGSKAASRSRTPSSACRAGDRAHEDVAARAAVTRHVALRHERAEAPSHHHGLDEVEPPGQRLDVVGHLRHRPALTGRRRPSGRWHGGPARGRASLRPRAGRAPGTTPTRRDPGRRAARSAAAPPPSRGRGARRRRPERAYLHATPSPARVPVPRRTRGSGERAARP